MKGKMNARLVGPFWFPPPPGVGQWEVRLGEMRKIVNARLQEQAVRCVLRYWSRCCANPESMRLALEARIAEEWRGGLRVKRIG